MKMKIMVAPDSFKGNMSATEVCAAIEAGILRADQTAHVITIPLADGGEGTARTLTEAVGGRFVPVTVTGPLGDVIETEFGLIEDGKVAVLDMAAASGIALLQRHQLNPMKTTSYGTGELIAAALDTGAREIIIGIGGSATNDGGIGMLSALGFRFLDAWGRPAGRDGESLIKVASVNCADVDTRLKTISITAACDVTNPLLGPKGASAVFGPQKGATPEMIPLLDAGLAALKNAWIKAGLYGDNPADKPGDGAAGGAGAALRICLGAAMESGAMLVMRHAGFFRHIDRAELIITGEGMTDGQTAGGKLCSVVAREGRKAGIPVALLSGALGGDVSSLLSVFDYAVSISCGQTGIDAMIADSKRDLAFAAENLMRAFTLRVRPA